MASLAGAVFVVAAPAQAANERRIDIPAGSLQASLATLAAETGEQLIFSPGLVAGRNAPALSGRLDVDSALARLLAGTNIEATRAGPHLVVLRQRTGGATPAVSGPVEGLSRPFVPEPAAPSTAAPAPVEKALSTQPAATTTVEAIQVTGTLIHGADQGASPLTVIDRRDLERSGEITVAGVLNQLPQVFGGQNTERTATVGADPQGNNTTYGTGVNLRGLGTGATLVLVNGRRLGGGGLAGNFVDVSTLPAIAVQRVEVLLDGASATYGADAVGGVVNIILRKDLNGGELQASAGDAAGSVAREYQLGGVWGRTWSSGGVLLAYEYYQRGALPGADRDYAASADLRPFGGTDHRITSAFPGNVVAVNPATGVSGPFFGIPSGQNGIGLTPAAFLPNQLNLFSRQQGVDLLPETRRQSAYAAFHQELTPSFEVSGDLRYGWRASRTHTADTTATLTVTRADPFFVSSNGAASNQIQYSFAGVLPNPVTRGSQEDLSGSLGATWRLPRNWTVEGYAGLAQAISESQTFGVVNTSLLAEALGNSPDNPLTAYNPARDGFFNPFTGVADTSSAVAQKLTGFSMNRERSQVLTANLQADGDLFALPGGEAKLALGLNGRRETFSRYGSNFTSTAVPTPQTSVDGHRDVGAGFAELRLPLVSDQNARPGIAALEFSAAVRAEHYSDFGWTVDPKVGALWRPFADLNVRATYGRSFQAPSLSDLLNPDIISPLLLPTKAGPSAEALAFQGGNPNLRPETADSYTVGFDYRPHWSPGSRLSLTWFDIDFQNQISRPVNTNIAGALTDPRFSSFVQFVSPATNAADLALVKSLLASPIANAAAGLHLPTEYAAIVDLRTVNTGELLVRGFDLEGSQALSAWGGELTARASATRLLNYEQRLTPTSPISEFLGEVAIPARLRGRASLDFVRGPLGIQGAVNYVSSTRDLTGVKVDDQTTVDLQLRVQLRDGPLSGVRASLSVLNLFDTVPPFYNNPTGFGFDATNFDALGRVVRIQLSKSW